MIEPGVTSRVSYTLELTEGTWDREHKSEEEAILHFLDHLKICRTCREHKVKCRVVKHIEYTHTTTGWIGEEYGD